MRATIVDRKHSLKRVLFWALACILVLVFTLPFTIIFLSLQWGLLGAIFAALVLPISAIICPFILIVGQVGTATIVSNFVLVTLTFILLLNAWMFSHEGYSIRHLRLRTAKAVLKRFYGWVWLVWIEFLGYCLLLALSWLYVTVGPLRQLVFTISLKQKMWAKDHPTFFGFLIFFFYLQVAVGIPALVYQYLGKDNLFQGIIGAFVIITFFAFQFQRMTPPYFTPRFVDPHGESAANGTLRTKIKPASPTRLYVCIANLGISTFKDCVFQVTFPQGFAVSDERDLYEDAAYAKHFTVRVTETGTTIEFLPLGNYLTFAPCTTLVFPICIQAPKAPAEYQIVTSLSSESAWGVHSEPLRIMVAGE